MNYQQTIDYLYHTLPMFSRMGSSAFKKDLTNIRLLCEHLGNPQQRFKSIHVGGTNGKGSVSHMLAAIFQTAGYKTGLYTSPHLYDFRERIRINGLMAEEEFVVRFTDAIKAKIEEIQPSFFEITVAMAFQYFAEKKVDIAIIEVGLGGRLDSTNIIEPELSIITNVGYDHMDMLGDTLEKIATEKAGIIKQSIPVVIGETHPETKNVFQKKAEECSAPIVFADQCFKISSHRWVKPYLEMEIYNKASSNSYTIACDLTGIYQLKNVVTTIAAVNQLNAAFDGVWKVLSEAMKNIKVLTGLAGRWDVIASDPTIVLEVAHNKDGVQHMLEHIAQQQYRNLHIVLGMVKDKDSSGILSLLPNDAKYFFTQAQIPRALSAEALREKAADFDLSGDVYPEVNQALKAAISGAEKDDLIVVCGSIFLVAEVDRSNVDLAKFH